MMFEPPEVVNGEPIVVWLSEQEYIDAKACLDDAHRLLELASGDPLSLDIVAAHVAEEKVKSFSNGIEIKHWNEVHSYLKLREHFTTIEIVIDAKRTSFKYDNSNKFPF